VNANPKGLSIVGWVITILLSVLFVFSATMKFLSPKEMVEQFVDKFGYPEGHAFTIGLIEVLCLIVYLIPRTAALGAILLTGYLGGAVATHVRVNDPFLPPVIIGMLVWFALFLRDPRIRSILPLRREHGRT
jgi:hypothetical protein